MSFNCLTRNRYGESFPDQSPVFIDFSNAVKRNRTRLALLVFDLERGRLVFAEVYAPKRDPKSLLLDMVLITNLKVAVSESLVPLDPIQQFIDRVHEAHGKHAD